MKDDGMTKGLFVGLLAGGTIGALLALLYAPKAGKELREDIKDKTDKFVVDAEKQLEIAKEKAISFINDGKKKSEEIINSAKEKSGKILEDAEKLMGSVKDQAAEKITKAKDTVVAETERIKEAVKAGNDTYKEQKSA